MPQQPRILESDIESFPEEKFTQISNSRGDLSFFVETSLLNKSGVKIQLGQNLKAIDLIYADMHSQTELIELLGSLAFLKELLETCKSEILYSRSEHDVHRAIGILQEYARNKDSVAKFLNKNASVKAGLDAAALINYFQEIGLASLKDRVRNLIDEWMKSKQELYVEFNSELAQVQVDAKKES